MVLMSDIRICPNIGVNFPMSFKWMTMDSNNVALDKYTCAIILLHL